MNSSIGGIGGIGGNSAMMMQGMRGMKRPDPTQMANDLFSQLDSSGQGYIQKSDLQAALDKISSSSSSGTTPSVDEMFKQFDSNSDGKVTKQEFSDTLKKVADQLDEQFRSIRMSGGMSGMGRMPPGEMPPSGDSGGLTKDQVNTAAKEVKSSDSKASSALADLAKNFDKADTNQDGKVSFQELIAFEQKTSSPSVSSSTEAGSSSSNTDYAKVMLQIARLMQAYSIGGDQNSNSQDSTLSVSA
ncbi:MAG: EF-hand domain-containing protein [Candidatus Accumulibacter sp.]|uniref:EF-hand domain-containing protein n=1 Tax=Candidatus Accumulibacter affinis TaxID=2954384 RepID=A0A935TCC7_9PROT|nr:EF-hand domain-containing protein [Candidatus Accumulibacter affinis]